MDLIWRPLILLRQEINEVIESREKLGNCRLYERWDVLKHLHAGRNCLEDGVKQCVEKGF